MEINAPTWLDASFVQDILKKLENDDSIRVCDISLEPAIAKGHNFTSDIYRISFEFSRVRNGCKIIEKKSLITKVASDSTPFEEMSMNSGIFETEIAMYLETLPVMNQMLTDIGMASLFSRCLHFQSERPIHLTFEDLIPEGFRMFPDGRTGLDFDHCLLAVRNLGAFHAASVALVDKDPMAPLTKYTTGVYAKSRPAMFIARVNLGLKALKDEIATCTMVKLKCTTKALSFENLQKTFGDRGFCEVIGALTLLATVRSEKGVTRSAVETEENGTVHFDYGGKVYRNLMMRLLPLYDSRGLLDV